MSASERVFETLKAVFTYREQMQDFRDDMQALTSSLESLALSHARLRDRVSRIEGYLAGRSDAGFPPRIEG